MALIVLIVCANTAVLLGGVALWLSVGARRRPGLGDDAVAVELRKLREGLDALTAEVERMSETQRLNTRLLQDASSMRATFPAHSPRTVTH